eukprot:TRINITY_DN51482_c0_g1_i1.p1 TRINITY_DN51482_c0_g1~~TRINITY_DN51482_c0_g1_i1.p1  ORF type:complete len:188 (+),score=33.82 TRINITY_DN51482_c0_g1_i1:81-566(+)
MAGLHRPPAHALDWAPPPPLGRDGAARPAAEHPKPAPHADYWGSSAGLRRALAGVGPYEALARLGLPPPPAELADLVSSAPLTAAGLASYPVLPAPPPPVPPLAVLPPPAPVARRERGGDSHWGVEHATASCSLRKNLVGPRQGLLSVQPRYWSHRAPDGP